MHSELGYSCFDVWCMKFFPTRVFILSLFYVALIYHFSSDFKNREILQYVQCLDYRLDDPQFESGRRKQICLPPKIYRPV